MGMGKRVIVCGGRDYNDADHVHNSLCELERIHGPFAVVIHGCADGVDIQAEIWAATYGIKSLGFRPEWYKYGKAAGPIRNQRMIDEGRPDLVVAFPGGKGTASMKRLARDAGLRVIVVKTSHTGDVM